MQKNNSLLNSLPLQGKEAARGFTLVELIVVITIIAILGTIAFITLQGYGKSSRDSARISDISSMKTTLELFELNAGKYPAPTGGVLVTYKGAEIRTQGTFGEQTKNNVDRLDKIPTDPLSGDEYTYSLLNTKQEYEIGSILEGSETASNIGIINQTLAKDPVVAYIKGTYNGIVAKVSTGSVTYALAIPSIIGTDITETTLEGILANKKLSYNNTKNIPGSYDGYDKIGGFDYNSANIDNIIVYQGVISALSNSGTLQQEFVRKLQQAYSGSQISTNADIANILSQDTTNDIEGTELLAKVLIQQTLDSSVKITGEISSGDIGEESEGGNKIGIALGGQHSCVLLSTGGVKCWGFNNFGQIGDGTSRTDRFTPVSVVGLTSGVSTISVKEGSSCALLDNGGVKCWGWNYYGQLGNGTTIDKLVPTEVTGLTSGVSKISMGRVHACALLDNGGMKCWGNNGVGQIGDGTKIDRLTPVDVVGLTTGVSDISSGWSHTCAVTETGGAKCWGTNSSGRIGDGTQIERLTPVDVIGLITGVKTISSGYNSTCALLENGGVKCWGNSLYGQLGYGSTTEKITPTDVSGLTSGVSYMSVGQYHGCAILEEGGIKCWGGNSNGQIGDNTISTNRLTPVSVFGISSGAISLSLGNYHTCATFDNNGIKCWGQNGYGQLGDGTIIRKLSPVDVIGLE